MFEAGILHRDISINNVMMTRNPMTDELKGFLIDLDLAQYLNEPPSRAPYRTGTLQFMAIDILDEEVVCQHTWRHDLESFYYLLLWVCVTPGYLDGWAAPFAQAAREKILMMSHTFERLLKQFKPDYEQVKELAGKLRGILFREGRVLYTETPVDHQEMYRAMMSAFDEAIAAL